MDILEALLVVNLTAMMVAACVGSIVIFREVRKIHRAINSRMDELIAATGVIARAEGLAQGLKQRKEEAEEEEEEEERRKSEA